MRIISANVNGIRSATAKGFVRWLARQKADVACLQELKAQQADLPAEALRVKGLTGYFHPAEKKGYSGVGVYARIEPDTIVQGLGIRDIDAEGRYLQLDFGNLSVISVYVPSGTTSAERLAIKFSFMERFFPHLNTLRKSGREIVLCGDWNVAHKEIDLKNWKSNQKNSGFLPEERAWLSRIFDELDFVDVFRTIDQRPEQYTWWSNRGQAWAKNVGWRLDYQIATPGIAAKARKVAIYKDERFSDHAPLTIDYNYDL
jgi:exodeoxyribonuclease-3